ASLSKRAATRISRELCGAVPCRSGPRHMAKGRIAHPRRAGVWTAVQSGPFRYDMSMLFLVIERFKNRDAKPIYDRARAKGRMLPEGVTYVTSWVETNWDRCFQVMEAPHVSALNPWIAAWRDLVDFEVVPVMTSQAAFEAMSASHTES